MQTCQSVPQISHDAISSSTHPPQNPSIAVSLLSPLDARSVNTFSQPHGLPDERLWPLGGPQLTRSSSWSSASSPSSRASCRLRETATQRSESRRPPRPGAPLVPGSCSSEAGVPHVQLESNRQTNSAGQLLRLSKSSRSLLLRIASTTPLPSRIASWARRNSRRSLPMPRARAGS